MFDKVVITNKLFRINISIERIKCSLTFYTPNIVPIYLAIIMIILQKFISRSYPRHKSVLETTY